MLRPINPPSSLRQHVTLYASQMLDQLVHPLSLGKRRGPRTMHSHQSTLLLGGSSANDTEGIRTPAARGQWISSPSP